MGYSIVSVLNKNGFRIILLMYKIHLVISFMTISASSIKPYSRGQNVCITDTCNTTASLILKNMNESVDPCDDFYQFACGNFIESSEIPIEAESVEIYYNTSREIYEKLEKSLQEKVSADEPRTFRMLKEYYRKCLYEDKILEVEYLEILKELGGWPLLEGKLWNESSFDWINITYEFQKLGYMGEHFMKITAKRSVTNYNKFTIEVSPPEHIGNNEYFQEILALNKTEAYLKYVVTVAKIFKTNSSDVTQEINQMLDFEIELSKIAFHNKIEKNQTITINKLQKKFPTIDWLDFLNKKLFPQQRLTGTDEVIVKNSTYFENLFKLLAKTPKRELANYAFWSFYEQNSKILSPRLWKIESNFLKNVKGSNFIHYKNSRECVNRLVMDFTVAMNMFYVKKHFDTKKKELVLNMVEDIRTSLKKIFENTSWFDAETKNSTLGKLEKIFVEIGYPDKLSDIDVLDSYHSYLDMNSKNSVKNRLSISGNRMQFNKVSNYFKSDWFLYYGPNVVNANYFPELNVASIFLGTIELDIIDVDIPKYLIYGTMGKTIGHELGHAFDSEEELFSEFRRTNHSWNSTIEDEFFRRSRCIADEYSNYTLKDTEIKLNGNQTTTEDVADYVGWKAAYNAYKEWQKKNGQEARLPGLEKYSPEQMYWLSSAQFFCQKISTNLLINLVSEDPHTVNEFRTNGALFNRPEFSEDFKCPVGSKMNPAHKCILYKK